jgi:hypothetical protein
MASLSIVCAAYDEFAGLWATIQGIRADPASKGVQFIVVDNFGCKDTENLCKHWGVAKYILAKDRHGTAYPRDLAIRSADCEFAMCVDPHIVLAHGALARLRRFLDANPDCDDILQGPLLMDDGRQFATHFKPEWSAGMWGQWKADERGKDPDGDPFEIPMQGLGLFCVRRDSWPGFNPAFRGFGGEEGYIHMKYLARGSRTLCLPFLRWYHRFHTANKPPRYKNDLIDRAFNYLVGFAELGVDDGECYRHFLSIGLEDYVLQRLREQARKVIEAQQKSSSEI